MGKEKHLFIRNLLRFKIWIYGGFNMCNIWDALSALGTCTAVIISLWIAQKDKKKSKN